jgi:hypothetical protein
MAVVVVVDRAELEDLVVAVIMVFLAHPEPEVVVEVLIPEVRVSWF